MDRGTLGCVATRAAHKQVDRTASIRSPAQLKQYLVHFLLGAHEGNVVRMRGKYSRISKLQPTEQLQHCNPRIQMMRLYKTFIK